MILLLAISAPGWTAIGAVGGAFVGATAGALADGYFEWRRDRGLAKAGARLLAREISDADFGLREAQSEMKWWAFYDDPLSSWEEYKAIFARTLRAGEFEAVSRSATDIRGLFEKMPAAIHWEDGQRYGDLTGGAETFDPVRTDAAAAYNALAKLSGHSAVGDRIHLAKEPAA